MSMTGTAAPYRREDRHLVRIPVVMPLVEVDVDERGYLAVRLDREPYSADNTLTREDLQRLLRDIATDLGTAVRVEVRETDGSTFTDIVTGTDIDTEPAQPEPLPGHTPTARPAMASAFGICADGFTAGEPVEVCVIVARQIADDDGATRLRLPPALLETHPGVVLLGRSSGIVALSEGPS